jgi:hypothetical protein
VRGLAFLGCGSLLPLYVLNPTTELCGRTHTAILERARHTRINHCGVDGFAGCEESVLAAAVREVFWCGTYVI